MGRPSACEGCGVCARCAWAAYMRELYQSKTPEERRAAYAGRNPEVARRSDAKRKGTPRRRASLNAAGKRAREREPEKYRARTTVGNALRDGRLVRQPCPCGETRSQAHHEDYEQPLEVIWLCDKHHKERHP